MTKIAYLECPTGIAGDMCLGALVHAGVPLEYLIEKLYGLGISQDYQLRAEAVHRNSQLATKVYVDLTAIAQEGQEGSSIGDRQREIDATDSPEPTTFSHHPHHEHQHSEASASHPTPHRHLPEIESLIINAGLPERAQTWSLAVFRTLAEAEAAVHGIAPEAVHFHEVGATDAIVDIVGTCLGLDWLEIDELYCSPLPTGGGTVRAAHGLLTVPTPAVLKLWELHACPVYNNGIERELCTPTGTAIACTLSKRFGPPPPMKIDRVGLGAGSRQLPIPNILRLWIGERAMEDSPVTGETNFSTELLLSAGNGQETIAVLETQIDDLSPQAIAYIFDALFAAGAVDVFTQPIVMKKSRLGVLLTAICHPQRQQACEHVIFRETTTLGIRCSTQRRTILHREIHQVQTEYGEVRVKIAKTGDAISNVQPEYEDCAQLARLHQVSWREIHRLALQSWYHRLSS